MAHTKLLLLLTLAGFFLYACSQPPSSVSVDRQQVKQEAQEMLSAYFTDIAARGLTAEFQYLDSTSDFFWVPPGYQSALDYDSVRTVLRSNALNFQSIQFEWESLQIHPISATSASYTGIVSGRMIDTAAQVFEVNMIETGVLIKRVDGWKILCGQSRNLDSTSE